jgi:tyrosyl-tRNA synthetase
MGIQFGRIGWRVGRIKRTRRKRVVLRLKLNQLKFHRNSRWKRNRKYKNMANLILKHCTRRRLRSKYLNLKE